MMNLESLIIEYGKAMMAFGKDAPDLQAQTFDNCQFKLKLKQNPLFLRCPGNIQVDILEYGYECAKYAYCKENPNSSWAKETLAKYVAGGPQIPNWLSEYVNTHNTPLTITPNTITPISNITILITEYGKAMTAFGMLSTNEHKEDLVNPTEELKRNPIFLHCPEDIQEDIIKYGSQFSSYGRSLCSDSPYAKETFTKYADTKGPQIPHFLNRYIQSHNSLSTINNLESLIIEYGKAMMAFGQETPPELIEEDPPCELQLKQNPAFLQCPSDIQIGILEYGFDCALYASGKKNPNTSSSLAKRTIAQYGDEGPQIPSWLSEHINTHSVNKSSPKQTSSAVTTLPKLGNSLSTLFEASITQDRQNDGR